MFLANRLSDHAHVRVWSEYDIPPYFSKLLGAVKIRPQILRFPMRGVFVFVGTYFWVGNWLRLARPERIVVISNTPDLGGQALKARFARHHLRCPVTVGYASPAMATLSGLPGKVLFSPIDFDNLAKPRARVKGAPFVIGRLSRDVLQKHHPDDVALYQKLADLGFRVRIMGGMCLKNVLGDIGNIELLPCGTEPVADFLATLDCFYYRTAPTWVEAHGRVITEAMAAGLPIIAGSSGGYAGYLIRQAETGILIDSNEQAMHWLLRFRAGDEIAQKLVLAAQEHVKTLNEESLADVLSYVLGPCGPDLRSMLASS